MNDTKKLLFIVLLVIAYSFYVWSVFDGISSSFEHKSGKEPAPVNAVADLFGIPVSTLLTAYIAALFGISQSTKNLRINPFKIKDWAKLDPASPTFDWLHSAFVLVHIGILVAALITLAKIGEESTAAMITAIAKSAGGFFVAIVAIYFRKDA